MGLHEKIEAAAQKLGGHAKQAAGEVSDNQDLVAEGKADQVTGAVKQAGEKIRDAAGTVTDAVRNALHTED